MADLMSGPNAPLTRAFIFCGWRCITIDWLINPQHDLAHPEFQQELHEMLQQADCICAALDCSTKSRAREIPRKFEDGRPAPKPLRSDEHPTGLPHLRGSDLRRVTKDNQACDFVLQEIQELADRGGVSLRENPARSLHWELPREKQMLASGDWQDTCYAACCFMGARCKQQRLRHNIQEISQWPHSNAIISTTQMSGSPTPWMGSESSLAMRKLSTQPRWPSPLRCPLVGGQYVLVEPSCASLGCRRLRLWAAGSTGFTTTPALCAAGL